ncbi:MAG: HAD-IIIA family hydrolase [Candidatus Omnitrophica bacterium]|nr:HAD-IIIA family hydrolase [Candidatus Omnitrophota bacterium]
MGINLSREKKKAFVNTVQDIKCRAKKIKMLLMDVDGVLTPGSMIISDSGKEIKAFDVHDGFGIMLWHKAGLKSAIITAGDSKAVARRADTLNIDRVFQNAKDKLCFYDKIKNEFGLRDDQVCFIGDDLIDIPVLKRAGLSCAVSNAREDIHDYAHYRCRARGGRGAVREVIDMILKIKGLWPGVTGIYRL